ncbi:MAG: hypothetical protein M0Z84_02800 [Gammaproteobacteria bacterium]|nr:hypothetical protein [Gammaproteobacteria bacterium]
METHAESILNNGGELERVAQAAKDSLTDDMVGRLAATATGAMDLVDRINRTGLADAIPALAALVQNGDLERITHLARLVGSAQDALTDDMVGRLSQTVSNGLDLMDQVGRAGFERAIPVLSRLVSDGDLERIVQLARLVSSAQDALTDDMVGRLSETVGEGLSLLDRLNRAGAGQLIGVLEQMHSSGALERIAAILPSLMGRLERLNVMLEAIERSATALVGEAPASGGIGGAWRLLGNSENQEVMRFLFGIGRELRATFVQKK